MATEPTSENKSETEFGITFTETRSATQNEMVAPKSHSMPSPEQLQQESDASRLKGVFNVSEAFNATHELGTIVTDKRNKKASLSDNLQSAFSEWWGGVRKSTHPVLSTMIAPKRPEEVRIPKAETRVKIIESATTNSSIAPKDDHNEVFEKVKTYRHDVEKVIGTPFTIKATGAKEEEAPQWTHTVSAVKTPVPPAKRETTVTEVRTPTDFRTSMVAPIVEKHITKDIKDFYKKPEQGKESKNTIRATPSNQIAYMHIPGMVEKKPEPAPKKSAPVAPQIQQMTRVAPDIIPSVGSSLKTENIGYYARTHVETPVKPLREEPIPAPIIPQAPPENSVRIPVTEVFRAVPRKEAGTVERAPRTQIPDDNRNVLRTALLWAVLPGIAVVGILIVVFSGTTSTTPASDTVIVRETVSANIPHLLNVDTETPIPLTNRAEFMSMFNERIAASASGITQYYPTIEDGGFVRPATSGEFFATLGLTLPENATRALDATYVIGSVTTLGINEPFIILRSYSFDTLFAGMLAWEPSLRSDFSPLFDNSYVEHEIFEDAIKNNAAVRILYNALGEETLMYAFVDSNTVIITPSVDALAVIIDRL